MPEEILTLQVGRTYRAKKPAKAGDAWNVLVNDRTIVWVGSCEVQYCGPVVRIGRRYPKVAKDKFLAWARRDVTDELPSDGYAPWPLVKGGL